MIRTSTLVSLMAWVLLASPAVWAVKVQTWTHEQPKQFLAGKLENVVVSSNGEVMLGQQTKVLHDADEEAEVINALARAGDGMIYAATGPEGIIYRIDGDKVTLFATLPQGGSALSLVFAQDGKLLVGTGGGEQAKIHAIDAAGEASLFHEPKDARYIWAMARGPQGEIYAATGIEGQLHVIDADGKAGKVLADLKTKNILCLAYGPDEMIYAGTDEDGLIYRVNPTTGGLYVMYDAMEPEISAIIIDELGNIFASTASADQARPGREVADKPGGMPDSEDTDQDTGSAESKPSGRNGKADEKPTGDEKKEDKAKEAFKAKLRKMTPPKRAGQPARAAAGNAIYRIDLDGFITEVFREPVMILAMTEAEGVLYAATGNEGRLYAITPDKDRTTMIAKLESNQVTSLLRLPNGPLVVGTANAPALVRISEAYADKGTLTSEPLDASQIVKWGRIHWHAKVPTGTKLSVATRTGNVEDKESDAWEPWSAEIDATAPQQVASAGARFLQYRLTFETTVPESTAVLRKLALAWVQENRPPQISSLQVQSVREEAKKPGSSSKVKALAGASSFGEKGPPGPDSHWVIKWKAEDPNKDTLRYEVFFRPVGARRWVRIAKELKEALHIWDTRTVPDGKYETRVLAEDAPENPHGTELKDARISDAITVDNTPPQVTLDRLERRGTDSVVVRVSLADAFSPLAEASYSVDSSDEWIPLAAADDIFDSPHEAATFTIDDLDPGEHWIALRVRDQQGNTRYVSRSVTVGQ